jgi:hypothetical protein
MSITVNWPRFLAVSVLGAILVIAIAVLWHGNIAASMYADFPARPADEVSALFPFLALTFIVQIPMFCYMYLRAYPQRSLNNAMKFGLWAGFFTMMPNGQFWVGTPGVGWDFLFMQIVQGVVTLVLLMIFFQLLYKPADESWSAPEINFGRFLPWGIGGAVLVFVLDLPFHQMLAPMLFGDQYPNPAFPHRDHPEAARMVELAITYLYQLTCFCYLYLRIYPQRTMANALWFGTWLGFWVLIPNMQIFVAEREYTWFMLLIQVPEGMILTIIMMFYFSLVYRPKQTVSLAAAE